MRLQYAISPLWLACSSIVMAATADQWRGRSIYQVMTDRYSLSNGSTTAWCDPARGLYCGGSWQGLVDQLDYIQGMGFSAVWISPVTTNVQADTVDLESYHGYWQQDIFSLNDRFGSVTDLQALSKALHDREMYLMVDICVNHFAWPGNASSVQYDKFTPFNDSSYFHPYCPLTSTSSQTECWLGDDAMILPDIKTESSIVRSIFRTWVSTMVTTYNIDGIRLDSAGNVEQDFFPDFAQAAGVFCTGEINSGSVQYVCPYQEVLDSTMNYPTYYPLIRAFSATNGSMNDLVDEISEVNTGCHDSTLLGSFSENHDNPRFASYTSDIALAQNVLAYTILADGIPIIYQGQEQHYNGGPNPLDREAVWLSGFNTSSPLYTYIGALNLFRSHVSTVSSAYLTYHNYVVYNDSSTLAMRKGHNGTQVITVLTNSGSAGPARSVTLAQNQTGFNPGDVVTDIVSCTNSTVDSSGNLNVAISSGQPNILFPAAQSLGKSLCIVYKIPTQTPSATATASAASPTKTNAAVKTLSSLGADQWLSLALVFIVALIVSI